jgi:DNA invertase Pin-like site-specific DNA recombinase
MGTLVVYTRVSKDHDGSSTSPQAQYDECLALARRHDWADPEHLSDVDTSAWKKSVVRPSWRRVVEGIRSGAIDGLIVHHLDRMLRQVMDLEQLIEAIDTRTRGKFPIYSVHGDLDLSTPDGRFQARILTSVAQKESDDKSRRLKLVLGKAARDGKVHGGIAPYGWASDRVTREPVEVRVIERVVADVLDGHSLNRIARDLNDAGIVTRKGGRWHATTLKQILVNPRLAGLRTHHGVVVADGNWERIITPDAHYKLVELLHRPAHANHHVRLTYWLTGLVRCSACDGIMRSRSEGGKGRKYVCRRDMGGCGMLIDAPQLEQVVATIVMGLVRDHGIGPRVQDDQSIREVEEELSSVVTRLQQLSVDHYSRQIISRESFEAANRSLEAERTRLNTTLAAMAKKGADQIQSVEWDDLNASERADLAAEIIQSVVIHPAVPGRRFDPSRVEVWLRSDVGRV